MPKRPKKAPLVRYADAAVPIECPYGQVRRVVTGGEGGVANVHIVKVSRGTTHFHAAYDEVYYVLGGTGRLSLKEESHALRPGAVVVIPAGVPHAIEADPGQTLEFVIFGTPPMSVEDERARPQKP
jgi:mannose-6-phosphate isomerase-like protein (cupin superfamily)